MALSSLGGCWQVDETDADSPSWLNCIFCRHPCLQISVNGQRVKSHLIPGIRQGGWILYCIRIVTLLISLCRYDAIFGFALLLMDGIVKFLTLCSTTRNFRARMHGKGVTEPWMANSHRFRPQPSLFQSV